MPTYHMQVDDWDADPETQLAVLDAGDAKCGMYGRAAYLFAKELFAATAPGAGVAAAISGGVLPLADGTDSVVITISAHVGKSGDYRARVLDLLKAGLDKPQEVAAHETPEPGSGV